MKINDLNSDLAIKDRDAYKRLQEIGLPHKRTEEFREFPIHAVLNQDFATTTAKVAFSEALNAKRDANFYTLYILNGTPDLAHSILPNEVRCTQGTKTPHQSPNALFYLSESYLEEETTLFIDANLDKPLMIVNAYSGHDAFIPTSLHIVVNEKVHAQIVAVHVEEDVRQAFVNANVRLSVKADATLDYTKLERSRGENTLITNIEPILDESGRCHIVGLELDSHTALNIINATLAQAHTTFSFESILKLSGRNRSGNIISIVHDGEYTESYISSKHLLDDASQALFEVKSTVNHDARFSKTFQNSQTILLKDGARINANPKLILHTDELEAAHGATSGSLDEEALYYMQSRGIKLQDAEKMLINAIELQVIEKIENESMKELALRFIGE
ncbi:SufD family Fe-S cluster assembly protein [Sulfurospirillum sp. 1612]|uniref:SufD family Fe-S cluster assembly protein n=1 Tax=Sulfurospirillum sp. 1612 TaxID=3094835 RepID=UPI002F9440B6